MGKWVLINARWYQARRINRFAHFGPVAADAAAAHRGEAARFLNAVIADLARPD